MRATSLKALRIDAGFTVEEVAEELGVSKYTIYNYEAYKTRPNTENIKKILNLYGVNINEIRFIPTRKEKVVKNKK